MVSRDTHRHPWARSPSSSRPRHHHPAVVLVEMGWPSPPGAPPAGTVAYVASYGASRANGRAVAEALV